MTKPPPTVHWNGAWKDAWAEHADTKRPLTPVAIKLFGPDPSPFPPAASRKIPRAATPPPPVSQHQPVIDDSDIEYITPTAESSSSHSSNPDLPPAVICYPSSSTSSVGTYTSSQSSETDTSCSPFEEAIASKSQHLQPVILPPYRRASLADPTVRSSDPRAFGKLFPSRDRLSIRHDDRHADGNLNLRVDTTVQGHGMKKRPVAVQLFHLAIYDLQRRDFSLLRYGPDSGREVCSSKRACSFSGTAPAMQQICSALRSPFLKPRADSCPSHEPLSPSSRRRPSVSSTVSSQHECRTRSSSITERLSERLSVGSIVPDKPSKTTMRLEFSNYASVQLQRHTSSKKYRFTWWGHRYTWRRVKDKTLNVVSFHLIRDGESGVPIAHIVPEVQSPTQVEAERSAGGWIPPCFMWISDQSVIEAVTDVAE
ncbi:hypothetical protein K4F52_001771 [Lecanicillium sp. MT-2017a]|nr:hypothetical protein K4F52_001771 [Lecanicillium sp. MT-2017a]